MLALSLKFPAKRFHATPWGRQVNEGAVEWPPSPWRLLRSLIATWQHKFPDVPEDEVRNLVESLASPPHFKLPAASSAHTRHYMPLGNDDRVKVFDTFVVLDPNEPVLVVWPEVSLQPGQLLLLDRLLGAMSYLGRAESWVIAGVIKDVAVASEVKPVEPGVPPSEGCELVRTLVPISAEEHIVWYAKARELHRKRKLAEQIAIATEKGKAVDKVKLSKKDEQQIDEGLPATLFDALYADTSLLRKAGWNLPPGSKWINYVRSNHAFTANQRRRMEDQRSQEAATLARFAVCGPVRPLLTEAIVIGEQARRVLMGCSKKVREDQNSSPVFSGKHFDGSPLESGHLHAHFLCEAASGDGRISHLNIFAPMGFDALDEQAFTRLARAGIWGQDGYELQLVLLGVGQPSDFGGLSEKAGHSRALATSCVWESRTPFVLTRHLTRKGMPSSEAIAADPKLLQELVNVARFELAQREKFRETASKVVIEPLLSKIESGTHLGGHFTSWLKFRRERQSGVGSRAGSSGFGFRLIFPKPVTGPVALGYGCHFGLGQFVAIDERA